MTDEEFLNFLEAISACFISGDIGPWESRMILPFSMITRQGPVVMRSASDVKQNFKLYLDAAKIMKVDHIYRKPLSLEDCKDGTWIGTYKTYLLSHGSPATEPYTSSALLQHTEQGWKMSSILNARGHHPWTKRDPDEGI